MPRNKDFEIQSLKKKNHVIFSLYISENEIWESNNERNGKVSLDMVYIFFSDNVYWMNTL